MKGLPKRTISPGWQLLILVGMLVASYCVASLLVMGVLLAGFNLRLDQIGQLGTSPTPIPHGWAALMLLEGVGLAGLGTGALLVPVLIGEPVAGYFAPRPLGAGGSWKPLAAGLLILVLLPALSVIIAWNAGVQFPAWAHSFAQWAREKEDQAQTMTRYLTTFGTSGRLLVGLLVIAVVPAIAEELVFRGVLQRNLVRLLGSRHAGVWVAAVLFSAAHLEFFGFVPRLLLGLVLGYLYEWSGNILVPMAAHFTQNAFQLLLLYLAQGKHLPVVLNPDTNQTLPWPAVLLSAALTAGLLVLLRQRLPARAAARA